MEVHLDFMASLMLKIIKIVVMANFQIWIGNVEAGLLSNIVDFSPIVHPTFSNADGGSSLNCDRNVTITWEHNNRVR